MANPKIDYLSRDYAGLKDSLYAYAAEAFPEWQPASEGDFGVVLLELFAYMGDIQSYYTDRAQMENYLSTATQRESVLAIAYNLGYTPSPPAPASGTVTLVGGADIPDTTVPAGTQIATGRIASIDGPVIFETNVDAVVTAAANTEIDVTEGETVTYRKIGQSAGTPSQVFVLPHVGVYPDTIRIYIEDTTGSTQIIEGSVTTIAREWIRKDNLLNAEALDLSFEARTGDDGNTVIRFGDDINGAIPPTGLQIFASYRHGVGAAGNVASGAAYLINARNLRGVSVARDAAGAFISGPMTGGADMEDTDSIRYNAPRVHRTQDRAVSEADFRNIAIGTEGVTKANVVAGSFSSVTVYIAGPDGGAPTQTLKDIVTAKFVGKTLSGVAVTVASPTMIPVNLGTSGDPVVIELYDEYSQAAVKANVRRAIREFIAKRRFGQRITVGNMYDVINDVEGVQYVEIPVMARDDLAQTGTAKISPKAWELFTTGTINLSATGGVA